MTVPRDTLSGFYIPVTAADWTELLNGSGITVPQQSFTFDEAAGNAIDHVGGIDLTGSSISYQIGVPGQSRKVAQLNGGFVETNHGTAGDITNFSALFVAAIVPTSVNFFTSRADVLGMSGGTGYRGIAISGSGAWVAQVNDGSNAAVGVSGTVSPGIAYLVAYQCDRNNSVSRVITETEVITQTPYSAPAGGVPGIFTGLALSTSAQVKIMLGAVWNDTKAELTVTQINTIFSLIRYGSLTGSVTQDVRNGMRLPQTKAEWAYLLNGSGVPLPSAAHTLGGSGPPFKDMFGNVTLELSNTAGGLNYGGTHPGFALAGVGMTDSANHYLGTATAVGVSAMALVVYGVAVAPAAGRFLMYNQQGNVLETTGGQYAAGVNGAPLTASFGPGITPRVFLYKVDRTNTKNVLYAPGQAPFSGSAITAASNNIYFGNPGSGVNLSVSGTMFITALWTGSYAEMTDAQITKLLSLIQPLYSTTNIMMLGMGS